MLAVTRAIGDRRLKKYVSAVPEIKIRQLKEGDDLLILASDGVWDVLSSQAAVDIVSQCRNHGGGVRAVAVAAAAAAAEAAVAPRTRRPGRRAMLAVPMCRRPLAA